MDRETRLRHLLVLRMLTLAWVHDARASWAKLVSAAVANGEQMEPPVRRKEVAALRSLTVAELFDPDKPPPR